MDWISFLRQQYSVSLIQDLGATTLIIMGESGTDFLCHWLCCLISSSFNCRTGNCSFNFSVWKFQNWPCQLFKVFWLSSTTSNFIPILVVCYFVKIVSRTSCLFENFCLCISTSCTGFFVSVQNVVYPCQERCTNNVCQLACSSACDICFLFHFV